MKKIHQLSILPIGASYALDISCAISEVSLMSFEHYWRLTVANSLFSDLQVYQKKQLFIFNEAVISMENRIKSANVLQKPIDFPIIHVEIYFHGKTTTENLAIW